IPLNTFSPAATSCSGVTLAPSVSVCGTSDWTCGISLAIRVYSASVPSTTPTILRLVAHMSSPLRRCLVPRAGCHERRFLGQPADPEHERHEAQEDQHAQTDHLGGVAQRRRGRVLARVL